MTALSDLGIEPTPPLFYVDLSIEGVFLAFNSRKDRRSTLSIRLFRFGPLFTSTCFAKVR